MDVVSIDDGSLYCASYTREKRSIEGKFIFNDLKNDDSSSRIKVELQYCTEIQLE